MCKQPGSRTVAMSDVQLRPVLQYRIVRNKTQFFMVMVKIKYNLLRSHSQTARRNESFTNVQGLKTSHPTPNDHFFLFSLGQNSPFHTISETRVLTEICHMEISNRKYPSYRRPLILWTCAGNRINTRRRKKKKMGLSFLSLSLSSSSSYRNSPFHNVTIKGIALRK